MKVLTVRQPWAWLIVNGYKDIENRTWATQHRGPLLIQASAKKPSGYAWNCAVAFAAERGVSIPPIHEFGGIVGMVNLLDCVRSHPSPWFEGPVGWVLGEHRVLPFIPCVGRLYVFDASEDVIRLLPEGVAHR